MKIKRFAVSMLALALLVCALPLTVFAGQSFKAQMYESFTETIYESSVRSHKVVSGQLPPGLYLAAENNELCITGTPSAAGMYNAKVEFVVSSSGQTKTTDVSIDVWASDRYASAARITKQPNKKVYYTGDSFDPTGMKVMGTMTFIDGRTQDFSVLNECIIDYCTHGEQFTQTGEINVDVYWEAPDKHGEVDSIYAGSVTVTVKDDEERMPHITTSKTLPEGIVGEKYSKTIKATGEGEIEFGEWYNPGNSNQLGETGLTISSSGKLSGTPKKAGTFKFTLYASNAYGEDYKEFTITIAEPEPDHTHTFGEWQVQDEPTCVDVGKEIRYCTDTECGYFEEREIPATGIHDMTEWTPGHSPTSEQPEAEGEWEHRTCKNCDFAEERQVTAEGTQPPEEHTHSTDGTWHSDAQKHWQECECGEKLNAAEHAVTEWTAIPTEKGQPEKEAGVCAVCGANVERIVDGSSGGASVDPLTIALIGGGVAVAGAGAALAIVLSKRARRK